MKEFEKELKMLETLPGHQNVMRYLFHDTIDNALRIFTTRYDCTLQHILKQRKSSACPFLVSEIMQFGLEVVRGLIFLHENNIIHKNLRVSSSSTLIDRNLQTFIAVFCRVQVFGDSSMGWSPGQDW